MNDHTPPRRAKPRVAVYAIAKNEAAQVERWATSATDADLRLIADTGSTDETVERARALGVEVHGVTVEPFRYDEARKRALELVPADIDVCLPLDLDEELGPGWRLELEDAWSRGATRVLYSLVWPWSPVHPPVRYTADKIHARHGYHWRYPVHEQVVADGDEVVIRSGIEIRHHRDPTGPRPQYLPLLRLAAAEHPRDGRVAHMLASEARNSGLFEEATRQAHRALELGLEPNETLHAMLMLSHLEPEKGAEWVLDACAEFPDRREPWCELAQRHGTGSRGCLAAASRALQIHDRPDDYLANVFAWGYWPEHLAAESAATHGQLDLAAHHARRAHRAAPREPALLDAMTRRIDALRTVSAPVRASSRGPYPTYVVIPVKDRVDLTRRLLGGLARDGEYAGIYVFDNGSRPCNRQALQEVAGALGDGGTIEIVSAGGMNLHAMWNDGIGLATASAAGPCNVAILNNDLVVGDGFLSGLAHALRSDERLWAVSPNYDRRQGAGVELTTSTAKNGGLAGFAFVVRGELFAEGRIAFDEGFQWLFGDDDLVAQIEARGARVGIALDIPVAHVGGGSQSVRDVGMTWEQVAVDQQRMVDRWNHP